MQINENFSLKNIGYNPISMDETETPEAGGAAWRLYPNDIRDNRRRDGREWRIWRSGGIREGAPAKT